MSVNGVAINVGQVWRLRSGQLARVTRYRQDVQWPWECAMDTIAESLFVINAEGHSFYGSHQDFVELADVATTADEHSTFKIGDFFLVEGAVRTITRFKPAEKMPWVLEGFDKQVPTMRAETEYLKPLQCDMYGRLLVETRTDDPNTKATNPKEAIGDKKVPLWLCSAIAMAHWAAAQFAGLIKYGAWNWRAAGVRTSTYLSAIARHLGRYSNGERCDPVDGTHHLGNIMACCAILLEAEAIGKLNDDRSPSADLQKTFDEVEAIVARLKLQYADKAPKHWTINDEIPS